MRCKKCGVGVMDRPLMRMNKKGVAGIWWCEPCAKKHEPELYKNNKEEESDVEKDLIDIFYSKKL